jgi:hypothetical protein
MQRALSSRARASALSSAASKYRAGAGLGQQMRFAHKVRPAAVRQCLPGANFLVTGAEVRC